MLSKEKNKYTFTWGNFLKNIHSLREKYTFTWGNFFLEIIYKQEKTRH